MVCLCPSLDIACVYIFPFIVGCFPLDLVSSAVAFCVLSSVSWQVEERGSVRLPPPWPVSTPQPSLQAGQAAVPVRMPTGQFNETQRILSTQPGVPMPGDPPAGQQGIPAERCAAQGDPGGSQLLQSSLAQRTWGMCRTGSVHCFSLPLALHTPGSDPATCSAGSEHLPLGPDSCSSPQRVPGVSTGAGWLHHQACHS